MNVWPGPVLPMVIVRIRKARLCANVKQVSVEMALIAQVC